MKKKIIAIGFSALLLTASCDVLDLEPVSQISVDAAFSNANSAQGAVNGMYNNLQAVYDWRVQIISDVASDVSQQIDTWDALINIDEFSTTPDNSEISDLYTVLYRVIDVANNIITRVPLMTSADATEAVKNDMIGQAHFVRGLAYFELARFYGGMPMAYQEEGVVIKLTPSEGIQQSDYAPRATIAATYDQVEDDLLKALELLPETRTVDKASKPTARALLARFYLYNQNWAKAEEHATSVIGNTKYTLLPTFETIFRTKNTAESIFELQYNNNDVSGLRNWYYPSSLGGRGGVALHTEFYNEMVADPNDVRGKLTAKNTSANTFYTTKWSVAGNVDNVQVIRIAEMYLIRAEARAEQDNLDGAIEDLNAIRTRAGIADTDATTKDEIIDAILNERKLEFVGEGHRWFDLIRRNRALTELSDIKRTKGSQASYSLDEEGRQIFPFPNIEVLTNTQLRQNSAYR